MASTYTPNGSTKQGTNDNPNTWGAILNNQVIELVEEMVNGVAVIDVTGSSNITISTTNGGSSPARHATLEIVGTISTNITITVPSTEHQYYLRSTHTGGTVRVQPSGSSTYLDIPTGGGKVIAYINGTDIFNMVEVDLTPYMKKDQNLNDVVDKPTARTNLGLGDSATKTVIEILQAVYPIGSVYTNASVDTNPATLLGFGTWTAFAAGRVIS